MGTTTTSKSTLNNDEPDLSIKLQKLNVPSVLQSDTEEDIAGSVRPASATSASSFTVPRSDSTRINGEEVRLSSGDYRPDGAVGRAAFCVEAMMMLKVLL